eukprot:gene3145-3614_t
MENGCSVLRRNIILRSKYLRELYCPLSSISSFQRGPICPSTIGYMKRLHSQKIFDNSALEVDPFTKVKKELNEMQKDIKMELKTQIGLLEDCSYYYFDGKGKQIRPTTIFLAGKVCNMHTQKQSALSDGQRQIAMISEMIHTASLLHDDVIDEATTRRGKPSVNLVFSDKQSILAGDYILSKASIALARIGNCRAVELIAEIIGDLVKGEIMQLFIDDNPSKRFNDYIDKTYRKTASLIANSCKAVAVLGDCGEEVEDIVFKFGKNIGIAFQLVDDALDFTSSPSELGKPVSADLSLGLATAPVLYAAENCPELEELVMRRFSKTGDVQKAFHFVSKSDGIQQTMDLATQYVNEAIKLIELLDPSPERDCLVDLAKFVESSIKMENHVGVSDMVLLDPLTEDAMVENLKFRFQNEKIYTYIGDVVVSINPYKSIPIYGNQFIEDYRSRNMFEMPPHIFSLADDAYRSMRDFNIDQCIIISGESGSGKTEASKIVMRYVAAVSGRGEEEVNRVKEQLLQSNPVLEAFGNAKTIRNDNSSRFGKYMDLEFDFKGDPIGGVISNYLLEKSRVVHQAIGERNFHTFYQLLFGAPDIVLESLALTRQFEAYNYLNQSGCNTVPSIDDAKNFKIVEAAMKLIGFKVEEIAGVYTLLGAILHLGNVLFEDIFLDGMDTVNVLNEEDAKQAANLFGCEDKVLMDTLCTRSVESGNDKIVTRLSPANANYGRDALCKAIYNRLFDWLVHRINDSVRAPQRSYDKKVIGVLDIYGFEVFQSNSFEQFIINFCNEKLQQLFIELTLKSEQEEYIKEGIEWIHIDYFNNAIICDLIEKQNVGILALLDEECIRPGDVTDKTFLEKLNIRCIDHNHYDSRVKSRSDTSIGYECFKLKHYAGDVTYNVTNFIDKNNDPLYRDMSVAMYKCDHLLLKVMFPEGNPSYKNKKRPPTVGTQMKISVAELMRNLSSKQPHYIRCIKPNDTKSPIQFNEKIVRHESRYLGILENIRVRRAGYCYRQRYEIFLERYKMLCDKTWPNWRSDASDGVKEIVEVFKLRSPDIEYGKTKLFIRDPRTVLLFEEKRKSRILDLVVLIQKICRGWVAKHKYQKMKQSQIKISSFYRMSVEKRKFLHFRSSVVFIQAFLRGYRVRKVYAKLLRKNAAPKIIHYIRRCLAFKFLMNLNNNHPTLSPLDKNWPQSPKMFSATSEQLRNIYHAWRCHKYRKSCKEERKQMLTEKLEASEIFNGKKTAYPDSVPIAFIGDHASVSLNNAWQKQKTKLHDSKILFADNVTKINRSNAKEVSKILLLTCCELVLLNPKSLQPLYNLSLTDVQKITTSPFADGVVIFHTKEDKGVKSLKKGDFVLHCHHVIELVAKASLAYKQQLSRNIEVVISESSNVNFKGKSIEMTMQDAKPEERDRLNVKKKGAVLSINA